MKGDSSEAMMSVSVVIPALNEENNIEAAIKSAQSNITKEIIVVDGGSTDATTSTARQAGATLVLSSPKGRGKQLNNGALRATGDVILFLHADSKLPENWDRDIQQMYDKRRQWGCFETIAIDTNPVSSWIVGQSVRLRTRMCKRPYGDQGLFVTRSAFKKSGGFPDWPLLEDLAMVKQLNRCCGPPNVIRKPMYTSGRRWKRLGLLRTTFINQAILVGFACGKDVHDLAEWYK